ncbi:MAG: Gfo/Idh/MocA family oxidoreductase [Tepidisphaeraceae bacterium]
MDNRRKYALVGAGSRATMFLDAIARDYRQSSALVGLCDVSLHRIAWHNARLAAEFGQAPVPAYPVGEFDRMIREQRPDAVIVASVDSTHHHYVIRAMELGCDVICEKPMTIDADKARAIFDAIARTGRRLRVTFNYRYAPLASRVRALIAGGAVGAPLAVDLQWVLDTSHGADYFRRWHAEKDKSGGLLVHKSTHHFDMINWWIGSYPKTVYAMGDLKFYGRQNAEGRGQSHPYDTSRQAPRTDPFRLRWEDHPDQEQLFTGAAERESGYVRDRNVFGDHVTIEDTMAVTARYRSGVILSYSLLAYSPWEGFRASITGTKGRIEVYSRHRGHIFSPAEGADEAAADGPAADDATSEINQVRLFPMFGIPHDVEIPRAEGGHGGGDPVMLAQIFSDRPPPDPLGRAASHVDGAASILLGIAANQSIATAQPVDVDSLLELPA